MFHETRLQGIICVFQHLKPTTDFVIVSLKLGLKSSHMTKWLTYAAPYSGEMNTEHAN